MEKLLEPWLQHFDLDESLEAANVGVTLGMVAWNVVTITGDLRSAVYEIETRIADMPGFSPETLEFAEALCRRKLELYPRTTESS